MTILMNIIDFELKGNVIRFYLGCKTDKWGWTNPDYQRRVGKDENGPIYKPYEFLKPSDTYYGDDWDDTPYECNAGRVYGEFIYGYIDVAVAFDAYVLQPRDDWHCDNSPYCKDDFVIGKAPCIVIIPPSESYQYWGEPTYPEALGNKNALKIYFGDSEELLKSIDDLSIIGGGSWRDLDE